MCMELILVQVLNKSILEQHMPPKFDKFHFTFHLQSSYFQWIAMQCESLVSIYQTQSLIKAILFQINLLDTLDNFGDH